MNSVPVEHALLKLFVNCGPSVPALFVVKVSFADAAMDRLNFFELPSLENCAHPASWGHPDLCSRPCVYVFHRGHCNLRFECGFCHAAHAASLPLLRNLLHLLRDYLNFSSDCDTVSYNAFSTEQEA